MKHCWQVAVREIRIGFRNPWAYTFMGLFVLFMAGLLLINAQGMVSGYSGATGTMLNLIVTFLPLITLMLGSFALTDEKENGNWELLSTYPLSTLAFVCGKYAGQAVVLLAIAAAGFGFAGIAGWLAGSAFDFSTYLLLLFFSAGIVLSFLAISMLAGTLARNRWQALTVAVAVWFFLIIAWPPLLIAFLGQLPYLWIKPALTALTMLNPAEWMRLFTVVKLGGGSTLGPEYYFWMEWMQGPFGTAAFLAVLALWITVLLGAACGLWERGRTHG